MILLVNENRQIGGFIDISEKENFKNYFSFFLEVDISKCQEICLKIEQNLGKCEIFVDIEKAKNSYIQNPNTLFFKYNKKDKTLEKIELKEEDIDLLEHIKFQKIEELKEKLTATDYIIIKKMEGVKLSERNEQILLDRDIWREEIKNLEN